MYFQTELVFGFIALLHVPADQCTSGSVHRAGRDDVTTGKLFPSRGECLGLYRCVLIIFKRKQNHNSSKLLRIAYIRLKEIKRSTILYMQTFDKYSIF